jgi:hypothetical protein
MNKRGDVAIVLLVLLVLMVSLATLFSFTINSQKVEAKILDVRVIDSVYINEDLAEFYINQAGKKAAIKTFRDFVDDPNKEVYDLYDYINNRVTVGVDVEFKDLHVNLNKSLKQRFSQNFKEEFENYEFSESYLNNLKEIVSKDDFNVLVNKGVFQISMNSLEISDSFDKIEIKYKPKIRLEFNLENIDLHSFERIYEIKEKCKLEKEIKKCFEENLKNFIVDIEIKGEDNKYSLVTLTSKKEFLFGENFESVKFSFIPK